jgi:predicted ester cyclase
VLAVRRWHFRRSARQRRETLAVAERAAVSRGKRSELGARRSYQCLTAFILSVKLRGTRPSQSGLRRKARANAVIKSILSDVYRAYISCLNKQDWSNLGQFVGDEVYYNGQHVRLSGYREMLEKDFDAIPDLYFNIQLLISDPPYIASRLAFDCTPKGTLFGLPVNGRRISFTENVFYDFRGQKIEQVWSVIDKSAIEAQL